MGVCSFKGCKKKDFKDGLCTTHMVKAPTASATVYTMVLARAQGALAPNGAFAGLAASATKGSNYKQRIEAIRSAGPVHGGEETVHGVSCLHDTQPSNNMTVWFSWQGNAMTVWGLGNHKGGSGAGNDKYSMTWFDGTNKNWSR